jgi:hypothetical protein
MDTAVSFFVEVCQIALLNDFSVLGHRKITMQPLFESNGLTLEVEQEMMVKVGRNKGDMSGMDLINSVRLMLEIPSICDKVDRRPCGISVHLVAELIDYAVPPNRYLCLGRIVSGEGTA